MPKFNKGDRVRVRLASHSPYRGQIGVVDDNPESYSNSSTRSSGFWYMVRFEWRGLHPAARFMEEDLEPATDEITPEETPATVQSNRLFWKNIGNRITQQSPMRKYYIAALITAVLIIISVSVALITIGRGPDNPTPSGFSSNPTQIPPLTGGSPNVTMKLSFTTEFIEAQAGITFPVQPIVNIVDANGNIVTSSSAPVTLLVTDYKAELYGTTTVNAVNGVATFTDLYIRAAGHNYSLTAISPGLTSAISDPLNVAPGTAARLSFITKPASSGLVSIFSIMVAILDSYGNIATDSTAEITLSITPGSGTPGAILSGTTTQKAKNGVASFSYLSINPEQSNYKLTATSPGLTSDISDSFNPAKITES